MTELKYINNMPPSKLDETLGKACPMAESNSSGISSIWQALHQTINSRLSQDLKRKYTNLNVQNEIPNGRSRYDIKIVTGYQNKIVTDENNLAIIDTKTGAAKLYQSCVYSLQNECPAIVAEFLTGDVHVIEYETAQQILESADKELERIENLRKDNIKIAGADCRFCSKTCIDRFTAHVPYKVPTREFSERGLKLEKNYGVVRDKIFDFIDNIINETTGS